MKKWGNALLFLFLADRKAEMHVSKVVWTLATMILGMALLWGVYIITEDCIPPLGDLLEKLSQNAHAAISS